MSDFASSTVSLQPLLAFGAHPDDIEFGVGAVIAREAAAGRPVHFVVCSRGEAGTHGTPAERTLEAERAAALLGATIEFLALDGDAHLEARPAHAFTLAALLRRHRPAIVLAPSLVENQHPDHPRLGRLVRDATRLARYGGLAELRDQPPHAVAQLLYYALSSDAEPRDLSTVLIDVSDPSILAVWQAAMQAHASQLRTRDYPALQLARAAVNGARCGVAAAIALYPNDPLVFTSLEPLGRAARHF